MKLLVIVNNFAPDRAGGGACYSDMCYGLVERGIDVTVMAPYPFYPEWKDKTGRNGWRFWRYDDHGAHVIRFGFYIPRNPRALGQRLVFELSNLFSMLRLLGMARRFDAIMVYCPTISMVVVGTLMKAIFRKPLWLNVQDIASDAAASTGMVGGRLGRVFNAIEHFLFNRADVWSTISNVMLRRLDTVRRHKQPLLFLPNWVDADLAGALESADAPTAPGPSVRLLYAGNISGKQDLITFCKALHRSGSDFSFRIFGNGGAADELKAWVDATGDNRFSFGPFLNSTDLARELKAADFYVITERAEVVASFFPSKYVTALAAGTPVLAICSPLSPLGSEMSEFNPGPLVEWANLEAMPRLLENWSTNPASSAVWRENATRRADAFERNRLLDWLTGQLLRLGPKRSQPATIELPRT